MRFLTVHNMTAFVASAKTAIIFAPPNTWTTVY